MAEPYYYYIFHLSLVLFCYRVCVLHPTAHNPLQLVALTFGGTLLTSLFAVQPEVPVFFSNPLALPCLFAAYWWRRTDARPPPTWLVAVASEYCRVSISLVWFNKMSGSVWWWTALVMAVAGSWGSVVATQSVLPALRSPVFQCLLVGSAVYVSWSTHDKNLAKLVFVAWMVIAPRAIGGWRLQ